jgi:hypothetical protein
LVSKDAALHFAVEQLPELQPEGPSLSGGDQRIHWRRVSQATKPKTMRNISVERSRQPRDDSTRTPQCKGYVVPQFADQTASESFKIHQSAFPPESVASTRRMAPPSALRIRANFQLL